METWTLVLVFLWPGALALQWDFAVPKLLKDRYLQVPALSSLTGLGLSMCERKCRNTTGSLAFNYFRPDGKCECLGENGTSAAQVSRQDWYLGHVTPAVQAADTNCTCADGNVCVLDLPAVVRCPKTCLPPPPLQNATVQVTSRAPGARASYACLETFTFFGSSRHVTCSANFTWEGLNGTCKQTSWTGNPTVTRFPVPAPVTAKWRVEALFNMTTTTVCGKDLLDGDTVRLTVSMRVNYQGVRYTALNTAVDGWQTQVVINNAPWVTGVDYNVTVVVNCPEVGYQVYVNETLHGVYNSSKPCYPIRAVDFYCVQLHELHMVYP